MVEGKVFIVDMRKGRVRDIWKNPEQGEKHGSQNGPDNGATVGEGGNKRDGTRVRG